MSWSGPPTWSTTRKPWVRGVSIVKPRNSLTNRSMRYTVLEPRYYASFKTFSVITLANIPPLAGSRNHSLFIHLRIPSSNGSLSRAHWKPSNSELLETHLIHISTPPWPMTSDAHTDTNFTSCIYSPPQPTFTEGAECISPNESSMGCRTRWYRAVRPYSLLRSNSTLTTRFKLF
jgi:hypothetical protein